METTVVRIFDEMQQMEAARAALLGSGFAEGNIEFITLLDEAGAVEGNFLVGNADIDTPANQAAAADGNGKGSYQRNYGTTLWRGNHVLGVVAADAHEAGVAAQIMERHGGHGQPQPGGPQQIDGMRP